ncbi:helix-turn-helix transcriptional regulator [Brevundimonas sp.]|uniref:helix-turn-helix domain-containing protein n=1 Tax=Brevundimonas sp. TaxID=1871086 RepID=UPI0026035965|nr:helix-turn-helix transcriptional regulator [Brevundimonas sp.]
MPRSPDAVDASVGRRIGARRLAMGLSQSALAQRLGVSPQQVQKYEAGANRISASRLNDIAAALGVTPGALFPERPSAAVPVIDDLSNLRFMTATTEGRALAAAFPLIRDRSVRQALAQIAEALAPSS